MTTISSFEINLSKAGSAFNTINRTVTEIGSGWYKVQLNAADTDTLGDLILKLSAENCDDSDTVSQVIQPVAANVWAYPLSNTISSSTGEKLKQTLSTGSYLALK